MKSDNDIYDINHDNMEFRGVASQQSFSLGFLGEELQDQVGKFPHLPNKEYRDL